MRSKVIWGTRGKKRFFVNDKEVTEAEFDIACPTKVSRLLPAANILAKNSKCWPRKSDALGGHGSQKAALEAESIRIGVPTEYALDETGGCQAVIRSNAHQRDLLKAKGYRNNDGGYGQITS